MSPDHAPMATAKGLQRTGTARGLGRMLPDVERGLRPVSPLTEHLEGTSQLCRAAALRIFFPRNILGSKYRNVRLL